MTNLDSKQKAAQRLKDYEVLFIGEDRKGIAKLYNTWASQTYEEDINAVDHRGRYVVTETLEKYYNGNKLEARILDVASGSGMLAERLRERGFGHVDALDGSQVMLDLAKNKNLYENYYCNFMEEVTGVIENDSYDIVVSLGAIGQGHLETAAVQQMFRVTKPGGLFCISGVKERWDGDPEYHQRMRGAIADLEISGKVKVLEERTVVEYYYFKHWNHGILILLQKI